MTHDHADHANRPEPQDAVASLQQSFQESLAKQAAVWEKLSRIAKDESVRFASKRLQKTATTMEQFGNDNADPKNLMARQQQWLQDMVKDYAEQSTRYTQMFREIATTAFSSAVANTRKAAQQGQDMAKEGAAEAGKTADIVRRSAQDMANQGRESFSRTADAMNQASNTHGNPDSDYNTN